MKGFPKTLAVPGNSSKFFMKECCFCIFWFVCGSFRSVIVVVVVVVIFVVVVVVVIVVGVVVIYVVVVVVVVDVAADMVAS